MKTEVSDHISCLIVLMLVYSIPWRMCAIYRGDCRRSVGPSSQSALPGVDLLISFWKALDINIADCWQSESSLN